MGESIIAVYAGVFGLLYVIFAFRIEISGGAAWLIRATGASLLASRRGRPPEARAAGPAGIRMAKPSPHLAFLASLALLAAVAGAGCKARPAKEESGFLGKTPGSQALVEDREHFPFHRVWFAKDWNNPRYKTVHIAAVNTEHLVDSSGWAKTNLKGHRIEEDARNLALYAQVKFEDAFLDDPKHRFVVVAKPQRDSLIFELALIEVVPNKATLGALGLAATVVAAPIGAGIAAKETAKGTVTIEGRVRAGDTRKIVAMFADREGGKFGPINLRRATWYGHAHKIVEEWAEQWVKISNAELGDEIDDTRTWTLMPW